MTVTNEAAGLIERLRLQMTAVNQQFTHILALQAWAEDDPDAALDADLELAAACADAARDAAAQCRDAGIAGICAGIATACRELADWDRISAHPAERSNPPAFQSFDVTLDKFVR